MVETPESRKLADDGTKKVRELEAMQPGTAPRREVRELLGAILDEEPSWTSRSYYVHQLLYQVGSFCLERGWMPEAEPASECLQHLTGYDGATLSPTTVVRLKDA